MDRFATWVIACLLTLSCAPAAAEDAAEESARRAEKLLASLPAPSSEAAFTFDADARNGMTSTSYGTTKIVAAPADFEGATVWRTTEEVHLRFPASEWDEDSTTTEWLTADLRTLRSDRRSVAKDGAVFERTATRKDKGFEVVYRKDGVETERATRADAPARVASTAALLLLLRLCPRDQVTYEFPVHRIDVPRVSKCRIEVLGEERLVPEALSWNPWSATVTDGSFIRTFHLSPVAAEPLTIRTTIGWHILPLLVRAGRRSAADAASSPAGSAREAAASWIGAVLAGDRDVFEAAVHWPSTSKAAGAEVRSDGEAEFRARARTRFLRIPAGTIPRDLAYGNAADAAAAGRESPAGDATEIVTGPPFEGLHLRAQRIARSDGTSAWLVVGLPMR